MFEMKVGCLAAFAKLNPEIGWQWRFPFNGAGKVASCYLRKHFDGENLPPFRKAEWIA